MTTHDVAVVNWQRACRVVCFDCRREWLYFCPVDAARAADGHRARMATTS